MNLRKILLGVVGGLTMTSAVAITRQDAKKIETAATIAEIPSVLSIGSSNETMIKYCDFLSSLAQITKATVLFNTDGQKQLWDALKIGCNIIGSTYDFTEYMNPEDIVAENATYPRKRKHTRILQFLQIATESLLRVHSILKDKENDEESAVISSIIADILFMLRKVDRYVEKKQPLNREKSVTPERAIPTVPQTSQEIKQEISQDELMKTYNEKIKKLPINVETKTDLLLPDLKQLQPFKSEKQTNLVEITPIKQPSTEQSIDFNSHPLMKYHPLNTEMKYCKKEIFRRKIMQLDEPQHFENALKNNPSILEPKFLSEEVVQ